MQPLPEHTTILKAVATFLKGASKVADPPPSTRFQLRLASSLTAMVARELSLQDKHQRSQSERFSESFEGCESPQQALLTKVTEQELSQQDWSELLSLLRADLADQLEVIAPHFDTRLEVEHV